MIGAHVLSILSDNNKYNLIVICRNKKKLKFLNKFPDNLKFIYLDLKKKKNC
jgi:saccharopine dehydrogenase-like NADP-dependent oxidoreductase